MKRYRVCYLAVYLYTTFSGTVRKWLFPQQGAGNIIFFIQALMPFIFLLCIRGSRRITPRQRIIAGSYLLFLLILSLNPLNTTLYHGLAGLILHLLFWMMIISYSRLHTAPDLFRYRHLFVVMCVIEFILSLIQYRSPENDPVNQYLLTAAAGQQIAYVGDAPRATGTFSYVAGFGAFSLFALFLCCYLLKKGLTTPVTWSAIIISSLNCLLNGSRGITLFFHITLFLFIVKELPGKMIRSFVMSLTFIITVAILNVLLYDPLSLQAKLSQITTNFFARMTQEPGELFTRIVSDITDPVSTSFPYSLAGIGLGSTYQGTNGLLGSSPILKNTPFEGELFRLVIEGGYLLLLARFILLAYCFSLFRFSIVFKAYLYLSIGLFTSLVFNIYSAIYTALGLILLNTAYEPEKR